MKLFAKSALASALSSPAGSGNGGGGIGFGCMSLTPPFGMYGDPVPEPQALELLDAVYAKGCRHFDTAMGYQASAEEGSPHNEAVLGAFFKTKPRESFSVATKYWPVENRYDYQSVKSALLQSLDRLGLEYVDLYYAHRVKSLEGGIEFANAAQELKKEGLLKEVGVCEVCPSWLRTIHEKAGPIDAAQYEWNLLVRNVEDEIVPLCRELDIALVAYSPLAKNFLTPKQRKLERPDDWRAALPWYAPENIQRNQQLADQLSELADSKKCSTAQLSLSWLLRKAAEYGVTLVPIPGSSNKQHAVDNLKAVDLDLSPKDMEFLDSLSSSVSGARAPDSYLKNTFEAQQQQQQ